MADGDTTPIADHDARLAEAADELERVPKEIAALSAPTGKITDEAALREVLALQDACVDVVRLAPAFGLPGLRAKARAILADGVLDGSDQVSALMELFARDVLRLVPEPPAA